MLILVWAAQLPDRGVMRRAADAGRLGRSVKVKLSRSSSHSASDVAAWLGCSRRDEEEYTPKRIFRQAGKYEDRRRAFGLDLWYHIECGENTRRVMERLYGEGHRLDGIDAIEPEMFLERIHSDDPFQQNQSAHYSAINVYEAWSKFTCEKKSPVVVQVVDMGLDVDHEDLRDSLWTNQGEIPGNNIDDDDNGYIDDVNGYNFVENTGNELLGGDATWRTGLMNRWHGSHVAGTIAAGWNNSVGGSGISPCAQLMTAVVFGQTTTGGFAEAIAYAAENGAKVSSNSWGYGLEGYFPTDVRDSLDYFLNSASGIAIFAAGNDNSTEEYFPAAYPPVVAVAAVGNDGKKYQTSNYGNWINISAPGVDVFSTKLANEYGVDSGTSMACPHVSGVVALGLATFPDASRDLIFGCLYSSVQKLDDDTLGKGLVDASGFLDCVSRGTAEGEGDVEKCAVTCDGLPWIDSGTACPDSPDFGQPNYAREHLNNALGGGTRCCAREEDGNSEKMISICPAGPCQRVNFTTAQAWCHEAGLQLCTVNDILAGRARDTGCNYNYMRIWTRTMVNCSDTQDQ